MNGKFAEEFAALMEVPVERITDDFRMEEQASWDSLALLSTIALIDSLFQRVLDPTELQAAQTFGDLKRLLEQAEA